MLGIKWTTNSNRQGSSKFKHVWGIKQTLRSSLFKTRLRQRDYFGLGFKFSGQIISYTKAALHIHGQLYTVQHSQTFRPRWFWKFQEQIFSVHPSVQIYHIPTPAIIKKKTFSTSNHFCTKWNLFTGCPHSLICWYSFT